MRTPPIVLLFAALLAGCDSFSEAATPGTNEAGADGGVDGAVDATIDAAVDAPVGATVDAEVDAGVDAPAPGSASYRAAVIADAPAAYWRMGEAAGANIAQGEIANLHASLSTSSPPVFGALGLFATSGSLTFDGTTGCYANVELSFAAAEPFTFEAWLFLQAPADGTSRHIAYASSGDATYELYLQQGGIGFSRSADSSKSSVQTSAAPSVGGWHHVVATHSGPSVDLYVDTMLTSSGVAISGAPDALSPLYLGAKNATAPSLPDGARLTEVAVYRTALSPARIAEHYRLGKP